MAPTQPASSLKRVLNTSAFDDPEIQSTKRLKLHDSSAKHSFDAPPTALYLFAGPHRRSAIGSILAKAGWRIHEVDILKQKKQDLSKHSLQKFYLDRISSNLYQALITSPPCDTFTRAKFANHNGPQPTRTAGFPRGMRGLPRVLHLRNGLANNLIDFSFLACKTLLTCCPTASLVKEHPEDLGVVTTGPYKGCTPASIWQWPQHLELVNLGATSLGLRQSDFGTPYTKPTRLLIKISAPLPATFFVGLPTFDDSGAYTGPIPRSETRPQVTLARSSKDSTFRTSGTAEWPLELCQTLAKLLQVAHPPGTVSQGANSPLQQLDTAIHSTSDTALRSTTVIHTDSDDELQNLVHVPLPAVAVPSPGVTVAGVSSTTTFPVHTPPANFWRGGSGPPRTIHLPNGAHPFNDGAGLTSPGRFDPGKRWFPPGSRWQILRDKLARVIGNLSELDVQKHIISLSLGRGDIFDGSWAPQVRHILHSWLQKQSGDYCKAPVPVVDFPQPFCLELIGGLLREANDADYMIFNEFRNGVTAGILEPLPRTPAVFEEQIKWRLTDNPFDTAVEYANNYSSLSDHKAEVRKQFDEDVAVGRMVRFTKAEFEAAYPDPNRRAVAALAALQERDKVRVLLDDGTHQVLVNHKIRCRDKLRAPGPREKFYLLDKLRRRGLIALSLLADVSKAHRLVKIKQQEWGLISCALGEDEIYANTVGTFGIASAAYWWSRLMGAVVRLVHLLLGPQRTIELLLYADDLEFLALEAKSKRWVLLAVIILFSVGTPLKWEKFRGGYNTAWIGFCSDYKNYSFGLTDSRADWLVGWIGSLLSCGVVDVDVFASGLGRLNFAALALIYERPFIGLLYAWLAAISRLALSRARLPWAVAFTLSWISDKLSTGGKLMKAPRCSSKPTSTNDWFRADAKATETEAFVGGWELTESGAAMDSKWFALQITATDFPWAYCKGEPKRTIAALELLATLLCVILFSSDSNHGSAQKVRDCTLCGATDNLGNSYIISRLMTTKFPGMLLLMELTEQLRKLDATLNLRWLSRDLNVEADDLTNGVFNKFDPEKRIPVTPSEIPWIVLGQLQSKSSTLFEQIKTAKSTPIGPRKTLRKVPVSKRLKVRDPW